MRGLTKLQRAVTILLCGLAIVPAMAARTCGGAGDVIGSFGWLGTRSSDFVPVAATPPGTANMGSVTPIGALVADAVGTAAFASVGRVFLDGSGGVFATSAPGGVQMPAGTYSVNMDCTVSMTLTDAFAAPGFPGISLQPSATFEGVAVEGGNEIDLLQTNPSGGAVVTLTKTKQACSNNGISTAFGISAVGVTTAAGTTAGSTPTTTPFGILGRFVGDGAGNLVEDATAQASPLTNRKVTGTYTVNMDCTGTAILATADGKKRGANFVIVTRGSDLTNGPQTLEFAFSDAGVVGSGIAQQQ